MKARIALFACETQISLAAFSALTLAGHDLVLVMPPVGRRESLRRVLGKRAPPLAEAARLAKVPILSYRDAASIEQALRSFHPDVGCIAVFPKLVPKAITALPAGGTVNLHPSLLPRHRGPLPLFWTYHADDRTTGLTVHRASEQFDAGDILVQESFPLERGYSSHLLNRDLATRGGRVLVQAVEAILSGEARYTPQQDAHATHAPRVTRGSAVVPFLEWDVERVWHFLCGLAPSHREPLQDQEGRAALYHRVPCFQRGPHGRPGTVLREGENWILNCKGGTIVLSA